MSLIKDIYSYDFYQDIADQFHQVHPDFDKQKFIASIFTDTFKDLEWKQRTKHTTAVLHTFMPSDFSDAVQIIHKVIHNLLTSNRSGGLQHVIFPDYIETYGLAHFDLSIRAFEQITQFITCEFAVRPFILKYPSQMIQALEKWSTHPHEQVRRLSSEGSRPRLPWAMAIPFLKKDPTAILPILENLKEDPSETVRRSVANSINDIAKDHPDIVVSIVHKWKNISSNTDAIIKHGSRTLLKQAHPEILKHYGLEGIHFKVSDLGIKTPLVPIGGSLAFSFRVTNTSSQTRSLRLEYGLYYMKSNGLLSRKVFKISEKNYQSGESTVIERKQSFKVITTRKFYSGHHKISIIVNGEETLVGDFQLTND